MNKPFEQQTGSTLVLWALLMLYAGARVLQIVPGKVPIVIVIALHLLPPIVFALIHGAMFYRWCGILIFSAICLVVGNVFENVGVRTGFPFGHYYFTDLMGPKLFVVPIQLGLAYLGMAYLSWTVAWLILGGMRNPLEGSRVVTLPLIAAFVMVAWDFSQDPVWSTILHLWIWRQAAGRSLLRRAREQLPRLVSHRVCVLPVVRTVFTGPFDELRAFAVRVLACRSVALRGICGGKYLARPSPGWAHRGFRSHRSAVESE